MPTVTRDLVRLTTAAVRAVYDEAFAAQGGLYTEIATVLPSSQQTETYAWLGELPVMREFLDERQIVALREMGFTIVNKKWEATIALQREVLEDDQTGQIRMRAVSLADAVHRHFDKLLFDLINLNPTAYDGVAFYHANHGNLTNTAFTADTLKVAISAMKARLLPNGEPMDVNPTHLLVPPALEWDARRVLNSAYYPDTTSGTTTPAAHSKNPLQNVLTLVVSPRLATTSEWHVLDCRGPVCPFIIQQRIAPTFEALDGTTNDGLGDIAFLRDEYLYGVRSRDNAGPGLWQYAYKSTGV